ncbi:hypothetical protein GPJ56_002404 [Histomonas meleagridis]|uniref:uncharacterized protein n=1 Tax=Histomonas meleagridis TaxID=135588 RepID=UPI0035599EDD|nr:hypothetical protein GPJ56_002404 [Histomonas meleagridis]KAH0801865.1 hypothetical protein GO595_005283 [Histomonas meleagridis]
MSQGKHSSSDTVVNISFESGSSSKEKKKVSDSFSPSFLSFDSQKTDIISPTQKRPSSSSSAAQAKPRSQANSNSSIPKRQSKTKPSTSSNICDLDFSSPFKSSSKTSAQFEEKPSSKISSYDPLKTKTEPQTPTHGPDQGIGETSLTIDDFEDISISSSISKITSEKISNGSPKRHSDVLDPNPSLRADFSQISSLHKFSPSQKSELQKNSNTPQAPEAKHSLSNSESKHQIPIKCDVQNGAPQTPRNYSSQSSILLSGSQKIPTESSKPINIRQTRKPWYEIDETKTEIKSDQSAEIEKLRNLVREQRTIIENQKETIRLLMNEAVSHEEITSLRAALASKSPLLQLVAATPMSEQKATKRLRAENAALRKEIEEIEIRHMNDLKQMRTQFAALASRPMPTDGCAKCKRRIRELEAELKKYQSNSQ